MTYTCARAYNAWCANGVNYNSCEYLGADDAPSAPELASPFVMPWPGKTQVVNHGDNKSYVAKKNHALIVKASSNPAVRK